jgi:mono/diheme cytochrome c family protein
MNARKFWGAIFCAGLTLGLYAVWAGIGSAAAQNPSSSSSSSMSLQRSVAIYNYKTAADSGAARGMEIYYYKCWMCHNDYTVKLGTGAVYLKDIFKRPKLISGQPVNEQTVAEKIKNGGPRMPAFRSSLHDADIADLMSYLRDEKCCFEGHEPPANPWYRY